MGTILRNWRVVLSAAFSLALVAGAYMLAVSSAHPPYAEASTETELLAKIANRDSTGDGLPDWQKSLYGIPLDATTTDYFHLGMTDGEAVAKGLIVPKAFADISVAASTSTGTMVDPSLPPAPADGTLTDAFAKNFFTLYLDAKQQNGGADLTDAQLQQIAQQALADLASAVKLAPPYKTADQIPVSGSGPSALAAYAADAEAILMKNTNDATTSEIDYFKSAVENGDASALEHIASISRSYRQTAAGLAALTVPQEIAPAHLALVNALMHVSQITSDFTQVNADPMVAMLALQQYPQAVLDLGNAFIAIHQVFTQAGVALEKGQPGASFVNMIPDIAASQASTTP